MKQVIELEWFAIEETVPDANRVLIVQIPYDEAYLFARSEDEGIFSNDEESYSINGIMRWCYSPFHNA
jgi:hypothetical protein